jgi:hypothetical protein
MVMQLMTQTLMNSRRKFKKKNMTKKKNLKRTRKEEKEDNMSKEMTPSVSLPPTTDATKQEMEKLTKQLEVYTTPYFVFVYHIAVGLYFSIRNLSYNSKQGISVHMNNDKKLESQRR